MTLVGFIQVRLFHALKSIFILSHLNSEEMHPRHAIFTQIVKFGL